jgi:probable selenium-dependent hydroxylase accessory protein YqeC
MSMSADAALLDVLSARSGLVCFVGAGGKKTTLYRLAGAHPGRVGVTATVHIPFFPRALAAGQVIATPDELVAGVLAALAGNRKVAFACPSEKHGRFSGVPARAVAGLHAEGRFDVTFIKADGARSRWVKAPGDDEPRLPDAADTVVPVVSALALGEPLSERIAHRVERIESVCGIRAGERIAPAHVARLLADEQGGLRGCAGARVVPLINMVDDEGRRALAVEVAERALDLTGRFDRVVLASMRRADPLVQVVGR